MIGIDIGSKSIKVVELTKQGNSFVLKSAGAIGYQGVLVEKMGGEKEYKDFANVLRKLFSDAKISGKQVSVSLPETQVYTRIMKFPLLNNEEIESAVKWEAEEYIPIPVKDAVLRHQILERQEVGNPPQVLVQVIAAPKSLTEKYVNVMNEAGLEVVSAETDLLALSRVYGITGQSVLVADVGARGTSIGIIKNNELYLSRTVPIGGDAFTRAVSIALGVPVMQAEQYKTTYGLSDSQLEGKIGNALRPVLRGLVDEMKKSINFFQLDTRSQPPTSVVVTGGSSGLPGFSSELTKLLGVEVAVGNPFTASKVSVDPESMKSLSKFAPLYSVAVGLAMREE